MDGPQPRTTESLAPLGTLSAREREVLSLRAAGVSLREIARTLCVEQRTVKFHLGNIYLKLGMEAKSQGARQLQLSRFASYLPKEGGNTMASVKGTHGRVVQVLGAVVDCVFPADRLPAIYNAVEIFRDAREIREGGSDLPERLVLEVEQHIGNNWVRCVAMDTTDGIRRGMQ
ncbi:MAG TPA: LuxR C-terminal-related transcriptional regulator, partial [Chloroflexota bacterium]|nr:LuxR C-terminal-related transcriptional regulator [Chloroflexota bacterium]